MKEIIHTHTHTTQHKKSEQHKKYPRVMKNKSSQQQQQKRLPKKQPAEI